MDTFFFYLNPTFQCRKPAQSGALWPNRNDWKQ